MEKFIHVERCDSTQDLLKEQLSQSPNDDFTVSCELQSFGRGRGQHSWDDSNGTICFSMNIAPHIQASFTALEISVLVSSYFESKGQVIKLKWPNDLQDKMNKKCGGILIQNSGPFFMAGIGINIFNDDRPFGSVYETSFEINKKDWVKEISQFIRTNRYQKTEVLVADWTKKCAHLKQKVKIFEGQQETTGMFLGLGQFGEAIIKNESGTHHLYNGSLRLV